MQALFTLTPAESKRLIAKGIVSIPEVRQAKEEGYLIVGRGSTNAYIVEELMGKSIEKEKYVAGQIIKGIPCVLLQGVRLQPVTFHKSQLLEVEPSTVIDKLGPGDILLKGANAIAPELKSIRKSTFSLLDILYAILNSPSCITAFSI